METSESEMVMTHDELLAKIDEEGKDYYANFVVIAALRAVVELHKPDLITYKDGSGCECGNEFPCPTIEAIEKELA